ncbi:phage/plasmid replication protein, II/X family [Acinetobacter schindleri]|uniref:phage/plasmid replication protein, II/X family n=1 Tax=Acinetobacter schindleri TaxID=108981 RepID=UPI002DBF1CA0|nr:phage/plasmid replication protein, II/X family [Acinetobacter schindleri]MEB5929342.1 phage/plasmid replication protein, II/X family [Acinetobacter schindleri]
MIKNFNLTQATNEVKANLNLYAIDYLKLELKITNKPNELSNKVVIPFIKSIEGEYQQQQESYGQEWIQGSYGSQLKVKAKNSSTLLVEENFFKWLYGHNVTGSTDILELVCDTVTKLVDNLDGLSPTEYELDQIVNGNFKIHRIDLNKAILFKDKQEAQLYLAMIKEHGTYPRRKKDIKGNGIYFGLQSKRTTLLYYHKGNEIDAHKKQQHRITAELKAYADCMMRCEVRLYSLNRTGFVGESIF